MTASDHEENTGPRRIALVACGKTKRVGEHAARDLYTGSLFRASLAHAERTANLVYVLSARHGLVELDRALLSYDYTLIGEGSREVDSWGARVCSALIREAKPTPAAPIGVAIYAGKLYAAPIIAGLRQWCVAWPGRAGAISVADPLRGMQIGQRLSWLTTRREAA